MYTSKNGLGIEVSVKGPTQHGSIVSSQSSHAALYPSVSGCGWPDQHLYIELWIRQSRNSDKPGDVFLQEAIRGV